jgi:DNA-binding HxlR family transcriptional regulator
VLADTLRRAELDGLVVRHLDPARVDTATLYQLTDLGRSIDAQTMKDPSDRRSSSQSVSDIKAQVEGRFRRIGWTVEFPIDE